MPQRREALPRRDSLAAESSFTTANAAKNLSEPPGVCPPGWVTRNHVVITQRNC